MDEEQEQFCINCKKHVGAANFPTHSAFCQRNIKICEVCDEPIPKNSVKEHEEEYHISVKCEKCNASVKKWKMPEHQDLCPKRLFICEFCEGEFFVIDLEEHIEFCGSRTELCEFCSKYIMKKHEKKHLEFHQHAENLHRGNGTGEVHQNMRNELISQTSEKALKPDEMYDSQHPVVTNDFQHGSIIKASAPPLEISDQLSQNHTVCHICRQYILLDEYYPHMKTCKMVNEYRECPHCNENIPRFAWKDHCSKVCRMLKESRTQASKSESLSVGRSQSNYVFNNEKIAASISTSSYAFCDELTEDDQAMVCPFCKKQWNPHEIQKHIESCPEKYFQCDFCCKNVLEKDRNKHLAIQCNMLQDKISSDFYECPLCGEYLLEKDKSVHESFACRTLLQIDDGLLHPLQEKTSKKHAKETEKNSTETETCTNCKKKIPINELPYHDQSCNKSSRKYCFYCEKELHADASQKIHLKVCEVYKQINSIEDKERDFYQKGAKPKHSKFSEITKPKVGKCCYCKTTLNDNILLYHEKECVQQPIKCPDCSAVIILKDADKHHCKSVKGSNKGRAGGRKTNKTEKPESGSSWLSPLSDFFGSRKLNAKTIDEYQNERNQVYAEAQYIENRYSATESKNDDLYFAQQHIMDDPKIPCEFCGQQFPASDIILHMTGCNEEVSLPKPDSIEKPRENEAGSRYLKDNHDSTTTSHFFSTGRGVNTSSTGYKSIQRRLEQNSGAMPGEFLNSSNAGVSSKSERIHSGSQNIKEKNQSSSAPKSVWNTESSDVEMEESDSKASSEVLSHNIQKENYSKTSSEVYSHNFQKDVNKHSKESTHGTSRHSVESDDEMSSMFEFIEGKTSASTIVKEKNYSLDEHNKQSEGPSVEEYTETKADRNHKAGKTFKNEYHYISNSEKRYETDKVMKESMINLSVCDRKKDSDDDDDDEENYLSKIDKLQWKKEMYRNDSDCSQPDIIEDRRKKQTSHNVAKAESTLNEPKKGEMSNFRFCGNRTKNSFNETRKLQDSKSEESDVYYKTNALGYLIVSEDENSKIRRAKKKDTDNLCQNNLLRSKCEDRDNIIQTAQEEKIENRIQTDSYLSESSKESFNSKYKCQDENTVERSHNKRDEIRTPNVSSCMPGVTLEMVKSKYEYESDSAVETRDEERIKSKTQYLSPSVYEKSIEMLRSKYKYQCDDDANQTNQNEEFQNKIQDVFPTSSLTAKEILRSKYNIKNVDVQEVSQKERVKSRSQDYSSSVSEKPIEMPITKHKYQCNDDIQASQYEEYVSKVQGGSLSMSEASEEILKYRYQNDYSTEIMQKERMKSRIQDASSSVPEKPFEMTRSQFKYQHEDIVHPTQKEETESKARNVSSSMLETPREMLLRAKYLSQEVNIIEPSLKERTKSRTQDISSYVPEEEFEMLKAKYMHQDDDREIEANQNRKIESRSGDISSSLLEKSKEQSKYYTVCPICRKTIRWIDYNTHLPACASSSEKCVRCGEKVLESDVKEHLMKCSKEFEKVHPVNESSQHTSTARTMSYDQVLQSLTSNKKPDVRKSKLEESIERKEYESARMRTSVHEDYSELSKSNNASRTNPAFKIEPALHTFGYSYGKSINNSGNAKEKHLKETAECPKSYDSDEDLEKWCKWRNRTSDDS